MKTVSKKDRPFASNENAILNLLTYIQNDASTSKECYVAGVKTQMAERVETLLSNPIKSMFEGFQSMGDGIRGLTEAMILTFLSQNCELIYKAFKKPGALTYEIALKNDDFKTREMFFAFIGQYESFEFAEHFPVMFQFISLRIADKKPAGSELPLMNAETH